MDHKTDTFQSVPTGWQLTSQISRDIMDRSSRNKYRAKIYEYIFANKGATCDEVEVGLSLRHQTASCFIRFLTQDGYLVDSGIKRITRSNRQAIIWKTKEQTVKRGQLELGI
jgi:hypothetical protein